MRAAVFSGAGNRIYMLHGAFEKQIEHGREYGLFGGTSSGSILALAYAPHRDHREAIRAAAEILWSIESTDDIARGFKWINKIRWALGGPAFGRFEGLRFLLEQYQRSARYVHPAFAATVGFNSGRVRVHTNREPNWTEAVIASSSVFPFTELISLGKKDEWRGDGGYRQFAPIAQAIDMGATAIDVYFSRPLAVESAVGDFRGLSGLERGLGLATHEIMVGDLREAHLRNALLRVGRPEKQTDKEVHIRVIAPTPRLWEQMPKLDGYLDFNPTTYNTMRAVGLSAREYSLAEAIEVAKAG